MEDQKIKKALRLVGVLEGVSFLLLLGVAMPLKYYGGHLEATRVPGMAHGLLFIAYIMLIHSVSNREGWPQGKLRWGYVASVLPFGTLVFDRKFLSTNAARAPA